MGKRDTVANHINTSRKQIREQSVEWLLKLEGLTGSEKQQCLEEYHKWCQISDTHQKISEQMQQIWSVSSHSTPNKNTSKTLIKSVGFLAVLGLIYVQLPWTYLMANHRSGIGEIKVVELEDGSRATLNTNSAISIEFDGQKRRLNLIRGEVFVSVAKGKTDRPFNVTTPHGNVIALGTQYSTSLKSDRTMVNVYESKVRLTPNRNNDVELLIKAGQSGWLDNVQAQYSLEAKLRKQPDWAQDKLIFTDEPLVKVVERLSQFRVGNISISEDVKMMNLRFTGLVPAQDSDSALAIIADSLGLKLHQFSQYYVWLASD